jgi:p-hydroxybenzoate 3-monooxygenase
VKDLLAARDAAGRPVEWEVSDTAVHGIDSDHPSITYTATDGTPQVLDCDVIAGCDGFHGISRPSIPSTVQQVWDRTYPYSWLGILADVAPSTDELIYAWHPDGFAMHSMRSPSVSRLYLQVGAEEDIADWPDDRIWEGLATRMSLEGWSLNEGPIRDKSITPMRSYVSAPMRHGYLFLAGDAAHIVPPTGAKGLNLALADVALLTDALAALLLDGRSELAETYSETAIRRVWRKTHFSWWMTSMLHTTAPGAGDDFDRQLQLSQLRYVTSSRAAGASLAENYAG